MDCYACKGSAFWYDTNKSEMICNTCHPNPEAMKETEKKALMERCVKGNEALTKGWDALKNIAPEETDPDYQVKKDAWKEGFRKWGAGTDKLRMLVTELNLKYDFYDCFYGKKKCDNVCWACTKNWAQEIFPDKPAAVATALAQPAAAAIQAQGIDMFGKKI